MIVYVYSKCSTCRNALNFLEKKKIPFTVKEITDTSPTVIELKKMLQFKEGNIKKLLNTSGQLYRQMQLAEKLGSMPEDDLLSLLSQNGMLIKRPFLLADTFGLTGFKEEEWKKSFS